MNDSVSILVAVFLILIALRWMLGSIYRGGLFFIMTNICQCKGGNQSNQQQTQRRTPVRRTQHRVTPQMVICFFFP